jgi:hypothetical protein
MPGPNQSVRANAIFINRDARRFDAGGMTRETGLRSSLIVRIATLAVTAGLAVGVADVTAGTAPPAPAAAASSATLTPASAPATPTRAATAVGTPTPAASAASTSRPVAKSGQTATAVVSKRAPATVRPTVRRTVYIRSYLDRMGSQAAVDTGKLVLWWDKPYWLAGHNYRGWQWLAFVKTGTTVVVSSGRAAGRYVVTGHKRLNRQSGPMPKVTADLVLQTCVGNRTGLTLLRRV